MPGIDIVVRLAEEPVDLVLLGVAGEPHRERCESGPTSFTAAERSFGFDARGIGRMMWSFAPPFIVIVQIGVPLAHGSSVSR